MDLWVPWLILLGSNNVTRPFFNEAAGHANARAYLYILSRGLA